MSFALMMLTGFLLDVALGWPKALFDRISHPVVWIGTLISKLERSWNHGDPNRRRMMGGLTVVVVLLVSILPMIGLSLLLGQGWGAMVLLGVLAWPMIAVRSMYEHVAAVRDPLAAGDLPAARHALSMIVGRDPNQLDEAGISRAALESLAENTSDGIVAPLFWGVVAGLPGIVAYKAINTMDSMIGHRNARYEDFGKVAARLDDLVNLLPARLSALIFAVASGRMTRALTVVARDARHHRSPNAGWPEAALAGGLGLRLSGPRIYGDRVAQEPWVNGDAADPGDAELGRGLALYVRAMFLCGVILAGLALL